MLVCSYATDAEHVRTGNVDVDVESDVCISVCVEERLLCVRRELSKVDDCVLALAKC